MPASRRLPAFVFAVTLLASLAVLPLMAQTQSPPPKPAPKATRGQTKPKAVQKAVQQK